MLGYSEKIICLTKVNPGLMGHEIHSLGWSIRKVKKQPINSQVIFLNLDLNWKKELASYHGDIDFMISDHSEKYSKLFNQPVTVIKAFEGSFWEGIVPFDYVGFLDQCVKKNFLLTLNKKNVPIAELKLCADVTYFQEWTSDEILHSPLFNKYKTPEVLDKDIDSYCLDWINDLPSLELSHAGTFEQIDRVKGELMTLPSDPYIDALEEFDRMFELRLPTIGYHQVEKELPYVYKHGFDLITYEICTTSSRIEVITLNFQTAQSQEEHNLLFVDLICFMSFFEKNVPYFFDEKNCLHMYLDDFKEHQERFSFYFAEIFHYESAVIKASHTENVRILLKMTDWIMNLEMQSKFDRLSEVSNLSPRGWIMHNPDGLLQLKKQYLINQYT